MFLSIDRGRGFLWREPRFRLDNPRRRSILVIFLVAWLAMAPELAIGLTVSDNFRFNLTWPEQFVELYRNGHLYPRWLPRCWDGLGSPVFYFYPPMFFWVTSLVDTLTSKALAPERLVPIASTLVLAISGVSMRTWLRLHAGEMRALIGSIGYMLAPYHLYDLYGRGALAEATAYASVPVVMLALARLRESQKRFMPVLALAFAALLFSHLPMALLAGLFLVAPYVAFIALQSTEPARFVARSFAGGLLGTMLAAVFILPALALLPNVSPNALSGSFYRPENWFFWHINAGIMGGRMLLIIPISAAALLFAAVRSIEPGRREARFWAMLTILLVIVIAGLVPSLWRLPGLALVQFPWRALMLVEFTTVTLLTVAPLPRRSPLFIGGTTLLLFSYLVFAMIGGHMIGRTWKGERQTAAEIRAGYYDAPEYLPAGSRIEQGEGPDDVRVRLPRMPLARASDPRARLAAREVGDGGVLISVDSPAATIVILRRFYFPHWQLHDAMGRRITVAADQNSRIVAFRAPAGQSTFRLDAGEAPYEVLGRCLSFIALLVLTLIASKDWQAKDMVMSRTSKPTGGADVPRSRWNRVSGVVPRRR